MANEAIPECALTKYCAKVVGAIQLRASVVVICCCSCSEAVVMLANIRQHAAYIASTIGYIDDQIAEDTRIVTEASVSFYLIWLCQIHRVGHKK